MVIDVKRMLAGGLTAGIYRGRQGRAATWPERGALRAVAQDRHGPEVLQPRQAGLGGGHRT